jgi:CubicO group peptidase (beta-lactamase class C family)
MLRAQFILILCLLSTTLCLMNAQGQPPDDEQIRARLREFVETEKAAPGIVVGLIDEKGPRVFARGVMKAGGTNAVGDDTIFEIGSITKVFTSLLLQDMAGRRELKLDDPISKFLPASVKTPARNGKQITLLDLATHTSGLPRLPDNLSRWYLLLHADNPYAGYTVAKLYEFLSGYKLTRDIGAQYEYSNVGAGLLGYLLSLAAGTNYESLVIHRICEPLRMNSTRIVLSPELQARFASGHSESGKPVHQWDFTPALEGCGALRSSVNDLLKFLAANLAAKGSPASSSVNSDPDQVTDRDAGVPSLAESMAKTHQARREADFGGKVALGWHISTDGLVWHNGGTGGFRSYMGFDPQSHRGVVVLANSEADVDALGIFILTTPKEHKLASIDYEVYNSYLGKYKLAPGVMITITRQGNQLFAQLTGQDKIEFFPQSETSFFCKVVEAELRFVSNGGTVEAVILHQNGLDQRAPKQK